MKTFSFLFELRYPILRDDEQVKFQEGGPYFLRDCLYESLDGMINGTGKLLSFLHKLCCYVYMKPGHFYAAPARRDPACSRRGHIIAEAIFSIKMLHPGMTNVPP